MRYCFLLSLVIFIAASARANQTPGAGSSADLFGGTVDADSKTPLVNVSVTIISDETKERKQLVTDNNGSFYFNDIKPGTYKVVFQKSGFRKVVREKVSLKENDSFQLNIEMDEVGAFQLFPNIILLNKEE